MINRETSDYYDNGFGKEVDIREILSKYTKHWKWFLFSIFFFMCYGYVYLKLQIPRYKLETDILIRDEKGNRSGDQKDLLQQLNLNSSAKVIDNEIEILKSNTLMEKVVSSLGLQTSYYVQNRFSKIFQYKTLPFNVELLNASRRAYSKNWPINYLNDQQIEFNGKTVPLNYPVHTDAGLLIITSTKQKPQYHNIYVHFGSVEIMAESYIDRLQIEPVTKSSTVLKITLTDAIPQRGKDVLNKLVDVYNDAGIEDKNITTSNQLKFIEDRIVDISKELDSVEQNVQDYKSSNNIIDISSESGMFLSNVKDNDAELQKIKIQFGILNNLESYLHNNNYQIKMPSTLGVVDPTILGLVQQLGEAQLKREGLLRTIPETNPVVSSIDDEIKAIKETIEQTIQNVKSGLKINEDFLEKQSKKFNSIIKDVPSKERGLIDVMRKQEVKNSLFTYLLQKREETALALATTTADGRTVNAAKGGNFPVSPVRDTIYLIFFIMGLLIPALIIFLKDIFNFKISKRSDIEKLTDTPILAEISYAGNSSMEVFAVLRPRSMVSEQIRTLRTNLQFIGSENDIRVLLFTSNISGEGKSFVSLNLGASLAAIDKKVIILELDLRKPKLSASLGILSDTGISNYLIGKVDYKDIIRPIPQQANYFIIASGPVPPNPAELLSNGKIGVLIAELKKEFDYILLDAPPVGLVTDPQILSKWADATLFIVRHNYTIKNRIGLIDEFYRKKAFKNLNIIFNSIERGSSYGYGYDYGYGYGYYSEDKHKKGFLFNLWRAKRK
ncbi:polysaccharide biosynthesis tyrosine autokinase [Mucilaginibacter sp.]|uniref:GumC family protein n=1 Tax=Mucilaginibacter sp. TaxID=1882438 RepID=UPI00284CD2EE|nr:polysaccharide biosynthesis tyrosine autokinase [Mucilaginibacter sp.]MDR3697548.1 polysaccharide biosynthesis tyrosine autokinase [Mucilaginibacter sp.]